MKKHSVLAIAALAASASLAFAQQTPTPGAASPGAGSKNASPAEKMESPSATDKAPGQMKEPGSSAKDYAPGQTKDSKDSARDMAPGQTKDNDKTGDKSDKDDMGKAGDAGGKGDMKSGDKSDMKSGDKSGEMKSGENGGKGDLTNVTSDQRSKVKSTFAKHRVEPAKNLNISVNVGVSVPRDVHVYAIPEDIVVIIPQYRRYKYFVVGDQVCIVDPDSYEIVDIIIIV